MGIFFFTLAREIKQTLASVSAGVHILEIQHCFILVILLLFQQRKLLTFRHELKQFTERKNKTV